MKSCWTSLYLAAPASKLPKPPTLTPPHFGSARWCSIWRRGRTCSYCAATTTATTTTTAATSTNTTGILLLLLSTHYVCSYYQLPAAVAKPSFVCHCNCHYHHLNMPEETNKITCSATLTPINSCDIKRSSHSYDRLCRNTYVYMHTHSLTHRKRKVSRCTAAYLEGRMPMLAPGDLGF